MSTKIHIFGGNIGIGTDDPGSDNLFVNGVTKTTEIVVNGVTKSFVPSGTIWIWNGSINTIPTGWYFCDGTNGTPDLRSKFIKGAGNVSPAPGPGGGASQKTLNVAEMGSHTHGANSGNGGSHSHSFNVATGGSHTHTSSSAGGHGHPVNVSSHSHTVYGGIYVKGQPAQGREHNNYQWNVIPIVTSYDAAGVYSGAATHGHQYQGYDETHTHGVQVGGIGNHQHTITVQETGQGAAWSLDPYHTVKVFMMKA